MTIVEILQTAKKGTVFTGGSITNFNKVYQKYDDKRIFCFELAPGETYIKPCDPFLKTTFETEELYSLAWKSYGTAPMLNTEKIIELLPGC